MSGTKIKIAAVAREILEAEGAEAVSMRRIASAIGLSPMALYRHYANREDLLTAVAEETFVEAAAELRARAMPDDMREALREITDAMLDFALARPRLYEFMFTARRAGARHYPDDFRAGRSPTASLLMQVLQRGLAAGQLLPDDVWEVTLTCSTQLHGLIQLYHGGRIALSEADFRDLCHRCMTRLVEGIGA